MHGYTVFGEFSRVTDPFGPGCDCVGDVMEGSRLDQRGRRHWYQMVLAQTPDHRGQLSLLSQYKPE